MVLAMEAWDLQQLSGGRFCLGLGSQVKGHNERRFGGTWTAPAPRMGEYIRMMHAVCRTFRICRIPLLYPRGTIRRCLMSASRKTSPEATKPLRS